MAKKKSADKPVTKPVVSDVSEKKTSDEAVAAPTQKRSTLSQALFWLAVWTALFFCWKGCSAVYDRGLPTIRFEWRLNNAKSSLGRWILAERPPLLKADYPAVGQELAETAKRLRAGRLTSQNAASADTIARVQPVVSEQNTWRVFLSRMNGEIQGGNLEKLAEQYDEAAELFGHTKAVEALADAAGENEDEKVDDQDAAEAGDSDSAVVAEGPDEDEDHADGSGEDRVAVQGDEETAGGTGSRAGNGSGCANGQCPTAYPRSSSSPFWPSYGLPW